MGKFTSSCGKSSHASPKEDSCISLKFRRIRRRRSLISAQRLERSDNPGETATNNRFNPEGVCHERNPFRVETQILYAHPGFSLCSNPGLKLANAFGVFWA